MKQKLIIFLAILVFLSSSSCLGPSPSTQRRRESGPNANAQVYGPGESYEEPEKNGEEGPTLSLSKGRVDLLYIADPLDGTYKSKVTVPRNFTGYLHIRGINVTSLSDRSISVRFKFGRELAPVVIPATVGQGSGIIPQTNVEVLILDLQDRPFENIRLLYDLFDYTDYRSPDDSFAETLDPVTGPRSSGLYCRGLKIEHDPTFLRSSDNTGCDKAGEKCHYAYAKIIDSGLFDDEERGLFVSERQIDVSGKDYLATSNADANANALKKCLPDNKDVGHFNALLNLKNPPLASLDFGDTLTIDGATYTYRGPFRPINKNRWEINGEAIFSKVDHETRGTGLFQNSYQGAGQGQGHVGYNSFLFPRAGKSDLRIGIDHFASSTPFSPRALQALDSSGQTEYMDGCNFRVGSYDEDTNESVSSCNVTALVELIHRDPDTGRETLLASSSEVKLQLIRPSLTDFTGREVLYSSLKTCSSSRACAIDECCFNSRCWSKDIVSQCLEDSKGEGNFPVGASCLSDYECSSLCCNNSLGVCSAHINTPEEKSLCSKLPGQTCVTREWCQVEYLTRCFLVRTGGISPITGRQRCAIRCYNHPTQGLCRNGRCTPPPPYPVPTYDPLCQGAIDPQSLEGLGPDFP